MSDRLYLLDTNILLLMMRAGDLGQHITEMYRLRDLEQRPLVCIVSHGEARVMARRRSWGEEKRAALQNLLEEFTTVDINTHDVIEAYVDFTLVSQAHPAGARNMGKNDLWIAACARAAGARLLTTDGDLEHLIPEHLDGEVIDPAVVLGKDTD
jgi:predicted nucleic acid-binding protein